MVDGRNTYRGKGKISGLRRSEGFYPSVPRRGRSVLQKRRRLPGIEPATGELNIDANEFINLEVDLTREEREEHQHPNPKKTRNPRIFVNLNGETPMEGKSAARGRTSKSPRGSFNVTKWKSKMRRKIEPIKSGVLEVNFMLDEGVVKNGGSRRRSSAREGRGLGNGGAILGVNEGIGSAKGCGRVGDMKSEVGSGRFRSFQGENNDTDDISIVLELNEGDFSNGGQLANGVDKRNGNESNKVPDVSCKDPQLRVMIPLLDDSDDCEEISSKRPQKKAVRLRRRNQVPEIEKYLDTNVIDKYMQQLWKKLSKDKQEHCTYLDCLWFSMYLEEALSFRILKWIKEKRIFSKRYVFIPIVHWGHWNLLILCHFGEDFSSKVRTRCMLLLDSLQEADPTRLEPLIRRFLVDVHKGEGREDSDKIIGRIPLLVPEVPQQTNGNDCGVFLLHFIDLFLKRAPDNFSTSEGSYPYFLTKDWFKPRDIRRRRKHINDVLLKEQDGTGQTITRRISTRSKKLHGFLSSGRVSNWIDLSSAA
uniref:Ubiquitin-like protease family profile domain-containing protein n=1 Tax=Araucaria cunninghamii TaxID=56994 RepID=A0A0D6R0J6_ARACU